MKHYSFKTRAQVVPEVIEKTENPKKVGEIMPNYNKIGNNNIPVTKDCDKVMMGKGVSGEKGERGREEGGERKGDTCMKLWRRARESNQSEES